MLQNRRRCFLKHSVHSSSDVCGEQMSSSRDDVTRSGCDVTRSGRRPNDHERVGQTLDTGDHVDDDSVRPRSSSCCQAPRRVPPLTGDRPSYSHRREGP